MLSEHVKSLRHDLRWVLTALLLLCSIRAMGTDFDAGLEAYTRGDYAAALAAWQPLAQAGDRDAQNNLAVMYDRGHGVPKNLAAAFKWYLAAAKQNSPEAQYSVGLMLSRGEGVEEDDREAVRWYYAAAAQGFAQAQYHLGLVYDFGDGVNEDNIKAAKWYLKAAHQGLPAAQYNLAQIYDFGEGVPINDEEAVKWYRRAADKGDAKAQYTLGISYFNGEGVKKDAVVAYAWVALASAQRHVRAMQNRGIVWRALNPVQKKQARDLHTALARKLAAHSRRAMPGQFRSVPITGNLILDTQRALSAQGYDPGPIDGRMGQLTREALLGFQRDAGLEPTGLPSIELLEYMRQR